MPDVKEKRVELILQQLEELPTLPAVALRVLQATADEGSDAKDLVELISADPALTARILHLIARADAGVRAEVASVERAVVLLGFDAIRNAVLAVSVFQTFAGRREENPVGSRFSREAFWTHCLAVACCAELLAEAIEASDPGSRRLAGAFGPSEAFICGLLHDLGKIALDAALPKSYARVVEAADLLRGNIADVERSVIGLDHLVAGKRLAERWQLPPAVRDCAWLHGQPPAALPANLRSPRLVNLVTLADALVRERHLGYSGNHAFDDDRPALLASVGLTAEAADTALRALVDRIEPRAAALGLGQSSADELYRHALAQANKELGQAGAQLAAKSRKLSARARFFDALGTFQSGIRPDASPQSVLQSIARAGADALGVEITGAFSLPPGQDFAEMLLCDAAGAVVATSLIDLPGMARVTNESSVGNRVSVDAQAMIASPSVGEGSYGIEPAQSSACLFAGSAPNREEASPARKRLPSADGSARASALAIAPLSHPQPAQPAQPDSPESPESNAGPVLPIDEGLEWVVGAISPRLPHDRRFWICLEADGAMIGGLVWGAPAAEMRRLAPQAAELSALANGFGLALRTAQVREEARALAEQLADANRRLHAAQNELARSKAMLAVGEMAAGAAHEMNNPLMVISGRSQLLAAQLSDPRQRAAATQIYEQSHRLSAIITEMMDFARPPAPTIANVDVGELIERALNEAKDVEVPADRRFEVTMMDGLPRVTVDAVQAAAALAEVIANAIHATEAAGRRIAINAVHDPHSGRVAVTVADDGCGMDDVTARRAFDPFFSNKPAGRRRGLGLPKALRWVEASGGSIRLESAAGAGTRVVILLPAAKTASGATASASAADVIGRRA